MEGYLVILGWVFGWWKFVCFGLGELYVLGFIKFFGFNLFVVNIWVIMKLY